MYAIAILLSIQSATGQKMVVIEKFTNTSCGSCPGASVLLKDIVANNDNVIWVSHYKNNGWFDNPLTNDRTAQLWEDISVPGNPLAMIDRTPVNNYLFVVSRDWEEKLDEQLLETVEVSVDILDVTYDEAARQLDFDIDVTFGTAVSQGDYRITAMIVEDSVIGQSQNSYYNDVAGHPLEGRGDIIWDYAHPNVVRTILDDTWGTAGVIPLEPTVGAKYTQRYSYVAPDDYRVSKFKIVCMVNRYEEGNLLERKILNANQLNVADVIWQLTDTEDIVDADALKIYPNPASNFLYVHTPADRVEILSATGQLIDRIILSPNHQEIPLSDLDAGIYMIRVSVDGEQIIKKFTVVK